ncbi:MAG: pilus assembly protein CpaB [Bryobacterales bacterium]|nr:pilus assembly protein CpaB [Bryobacterales bacterium]
MVLYRLVVGRITATAPAATTSITVATKNLDVGAVIADTDLRVAAWPGAVPQGAILKSSAALGRVILAPIYANEPITESRLGALGAGGGLTATIPTGMRAVAIRVNEVVGVAGFVVAGTHVDVLVSGNPSTSGAGSGGTVTRTLLQNISVLSAGQDFKKDAEGKPATVQVVNLLVTPQQAEMLSLASSQMTLQLVLRNPLDTIITTTPGITLASIFSGEVTRPAIGVLPRVKVFRAPAANPQPVAVLAVATEPVESPRMEIIEGSKRTEVRLQKQTVIP